MESKGVSEKSAAKQREIRHTVFMDKKGVDAFPGYRSKQTMLPKDQVWLLFFTVNTSCLHIISKYVWSSGNKIEYTIF